MGWFSDDEKKDKKFLDDYWKKEKQAMDKDVYDKRKKGS